MLNMFSGWLNLRMNTYHTYTYQHMLSGWFNSQQNMNVWPKRSISCFGQLSGPCRLQNQFNLPKKMVILRPQALISANWNSWQFKGENGANMWYSIRIRGIPLSGFRVGFSHFQSDTMLPHSQSSVPSLPPVGIHLPLHSQNGSDLTIQEKRWTWKKKINEE